MLQQLTDSANSGIGQGIPITFFVPGGMISGRIESSQDFLRAAIAGLYRYGYVNNTVDGELPEYADAFAQQTFEAKANELDDQIEVEKRAFDENGTLSARWLLTRHLHLKDAYYTVPGAVSVQQPHICVQLNQVVGWTLGITRSQ